MKSDHLETVLDAFGTAGLSQAHRAHARSCARCAAAIEAAEAVEAALAEPPPSAPMAIAHQVMERVLAVERAKLLAQESLRARGSAGWRRWAAAIAAEPAAVVVIALAPVVLVVGIVWPETASALVVTVRDALAAWVVSAAPGAMLAKSGLEPLTASTRLLLDFTLIPAIVALGFFAFPWIGESLRQYVAPKRPKAPTPR